MECSGRRQNSFSLDLEQSYAHKEFIALNVKNSKVAIGTAVKKRQRNLFSQLEKMRKLRQFQKC